MSLALSCVHWMKYKRYITWHPNSLHAQKSQLLSILQKGITWFFHFRKQLIHNTEQEMKDAGSSWDWARNLFLKKKTTQDSKTCNLSFYWTYKKTKTKLSSDLCKCSRFLFKIMMQYWNSLQKSLSENVAWTLFCFPELFLPSHHVAWPVTRILGFLNRNWWSSCPGPHAFSLNQFRALVTAEGTTLWPWPQWLNQVTWEGECSKEAEASADVLVLFNAWYLNCTLVPESH